MSAPARDPLTDVVRQLVACIRLLSSDQAVEVEGAMAVIQRLLKGADVHALADRIESGGVDESYKQEVIAQIRRAHEVGYANGVKAAEARFRPNGQLTFSEVALYAQRQIHRLPPDKHEFINKM